MFSLTVLFYLLTAVASQPCMVTNFSQIPEALLCREIIIDSLKVPAGLTLKLNLTQGATVTFRGYTSFGYQLWDGPLVTVNGTNITVIGENGSILDGLGPQYWDGQGGWSGSKPIFFTIEVFNAVFKNIYVLNSPKDVMQVTNSDNVTLTNWTINDYAGHKGVAPSGREGHNTDGFDVWNSTNIIISDSVIYNQDDCVALRCGANISVSNLYCYGSHGLSISVGFSNDSIPLNTIRNVSFTDSIVVSGSNGIHVKTHVDGGYGNITDVLYRNITIKNIGSYGILIQQDYSNRPPSNNLSGVKPRNNVPIRNLTLEDVIGSVGDGAIPIDIVCADDGCFDWYFSNVKVTGHKNNSCNYTPDDFKC